jgi:hypothetical protein
MNELEHDLSIKIYKYGIIISAPISIMILPEILNMLNELYEYDVCDARIACHYHASFCLTTELLSEKWRNELNLSLV